MTSKHTDGTECLEGTKLVPTGFVPCCDVLGGHTSSCAFDIRYEWWSKSGRWVIAIAQSAGGGGIEIRFCPHCGAELVGLR